MIVAEVLRGVLRRWYILLAGLILAVGLSAVAWNAVPPTTERTASLLLMPGSGTLPEGASNPYLYLGGLTTSADVLVRATAREGAVEDLLESVPSAELVIERDNSTSAPVISIVVNARTDTEAEGVMELILDRISQTLSQLQNEQSVPASQRIGIQTLHVDESGTVQQKTRLMITAAAGAGVAILTIVMAALLDVLLRHRKTTAKRRRRNPATDEDRPEQETADLDAVEPRELDEPADTVEDVEDVEDVEELDEIVDSPVSAAR